MLYCVFSRRWRRAWHLLLPGEVLVGSTMVTADLVRTVPRDSGAVLVTRKKTIVSGLCWLLSQVMVVWVSNLVVF